MSRVDNWEVRLKETFERHNGREFSWGSLDCAHFAADCIQAVIGADVLGPLRNSYGTRIAARARMRARGWCTLAEAAEDTLFHVGARPIDPRAARVGDIGVTQDDVICVRFPAGFIARTPEGNFATATNVYRAWAI